jgi:ParB family transcriptional regulator, chromosome partitioning protein
MASGLGRGLGSLIPKKTISYGQNPYQDENDKKEEKEIIYDHERILQISPDKIDFNPFQPRTFFSDSALDDLAQSIKEHGIIQPLIVTKEGEHFELIAGERRLRSARLIGLKKVPVIIREEKGQKKLEFALIENLQREDLNPIETAHAYKKLINEFNITQDEISKKVGKARSSVTNTLRLLSLPSEAQDALSAGKISEAHAKQLLALDSEAKQLNMLRKILRHSLTVAQTDKEVKRLSNNSSRKVKDYFDKAKEDELSQFFSTKVEIKRRGRGGQLIIDFYSEDEFDSILTKIKK